MKKIIDNFSRQSNTYKKYRPEYPKELYQVILSNSKGRNQCWDCGTGNGQVAKELANYFKKVYATDISENQIKLAEKKSNIEYIVTRSEETNFEENKFDLITVAQAIHWFDFKAFNAEAKRVGKHNSKVCIWGYDLLKVDEEVDEVIQEFYQKTVGSYWNKERRHIDSKYETIDFNFKEVTAPKNLAIKANWKLENMIGFLNSWSSVQNYKNANSGLNPVKKVENELLKVWTKEKIKQIKFPIFMKIGIIEK